MPPDPPTTNTAKLGPPLGQASALGARRSSCRVRFVLGPPSSHGYVCSLEPGAKIEDTAKIRMEACTAVQVETWISTELPYSEPCLSPWPSRHDALWPPEDLVIVAPHLGQGK